MPATQINADTAPRAGTIVPTDARNMILQLYREIGIGAVAGALNAGRSLRVSSPPQPLAMPEQRREDRAA